MSETSVTRSYWKRLLLLFAFYPGAMVLLSYEFGHGNLGPRGLAVSGLVLFAAFMVAFVLLARKSQREALASAPLPGTPIDEATRKRRLRYIRNGKIGIVVLAASLVYGLSQSEGHPVWQLLVGVLINLGTIGALIQMVVRLKKSLK